MTIGLTNIIHREEARDNTNHLRSVVFGWMRRNWQKYLADDGTVDVEALAEQAGWEFGIDLTEAKKLAAEIATEVK
jgi:hypothetical protein